MVHFEQVAHAIDDSHSNIKASLLSGNAIPRRMGRLKTPDGRVIPRSVDIIVLGGWMPTQTEDGRALPLLVATHFMHKPGAAIIKESTLHAELAWPEDQGGTQRLECGKLSQVIFSDMELKPRFEVCVSNLVQLVPVEDGVDPEQARRDTDDLVRYISQVSLANAKLPTHQT